MTFGIYSICDKLTGFMTPTVDLNDASAMRNFEHAVLSPGSLLNSHSEDYSLCCVGTFNSDTGEVEPLNPVKVVVSG